MKKLGVLAATVVACVTAGVSPALATTPPYPPGPTTTAVAGGGGVLPATGSSNDQTIQIAAGVIAVGLGLAAVGGFRRRRSADA